MKRLLAVLLLAAPLAAQVSQQPASAIVPVVSSTRGASGSNFKTGLQMTNPTEKEMTGWLLLHPQEIAVRYELGPYATKSYDDFVAEIGGEGAGSLDLLIDAGELPTVVVRSFDDQPDGTNGVTVPLVPVEALLVSGDRAALIAPRDPIHFRFNIGVRSLNDGAGIDFIVRNAAGTERHRRFLDTGEHEFLQQPASQLLGITPDADDSIEVVIVSGSAVVYGATVDNRTNDATLQVLRR